MAKAVYPGSFDPITLGHLDIIRRIQKIFGEITLLIADNPSKKGLFTVEERKALAEQVLKGIPGVKVDIHQGLTVDYLREKGATVIIRGLRAVTDFEYEFVMANMNKKLAPQIETMIVFASPEFYYVSSNTVKEVALNGGAVDELVPAAVNQALRAKYLQLKSLSRPATPIRQRKPKSGTAARLKTRRRMK
jgi:pantetheine-phosphate adenylyltransferase